MAHRCSKSTVPPVRTPKCELWIAVGIFAFAFAVRLAYLYESSDNPTFLAPIMDAASYDQRARSLAKGQGMDRRFFWQPVFYPFFLSGVYFFGNGSILCAKVLQALLGSAVCVLTYRLGRAVFDRSTGLLAGLITALYGPLIFFETRLHAAGWASLFAVALLLLFLKAANAKSLRICFVLGVCAALSIITRPTFLPFFLAASLWLAIVFYRDRDHRRRLPAAGLVVLTGFALVAIPAAIQNYRVTCHFGILPASGGINLYIGNNPNYCETLTIRPGMQWNRLTDLPEKEGRTELWDQQRFFLEKVRAFVRSQPLAYLKGLGRKTAQFINAREIPRNVNIYTFGQWSTLIRVLTWKLDGFGFPFGLLLPLALLGVVCHWRRIPTPIILFLLLFPAAVVLVFVAGRYRIPVIPPMSILAAAGAIALIHMIRTQQWRRTTFACGSMAAVILASSLPGPFCEEQVDYDVEMHFQLGCSEVERGRNENAVPHFAEALRLAPEHHEAHHRLAMAFDQLGRTADAVAHYIQAIRLKSDYADAHNNLGVALAKQEKIDEAILHFSSAIRINPDFEAYKNLGMALANQGKIDRAVDALNKGLRIEPRDPDARCLLGSLYERQDRIRDAITQYRKALQINPQYKQARAKLDAAQAKRKSNERPAP